MPLFQPLSTVVAEARQHRGFWYVGTPYSKHPGGRWIAYQEAAACTARLLNAGVHVFSPIVHSHPLTMYDVSLEHAEWMALDHHFMEPAVGLIVVGLEGWGTSKGLAEEIEYFTVARKPILWLEPRGLI